MRMNQTADIIDLSRSVAGEYFKKFRYPWEILTHIEEIISEIGSGLDESEYNRLGDSIWIHKTALLSDAAEIKGPLIVCEEAEIRHCAYIRGNAIIGRRAVLGNSCEIKNSILFDGVQVPHFNYVGDSVLGYKVHMGAGVILSNLRLDKKNISVKFEDGIVDTGLRKFGGIIGDGCEIGCNSVLNPGTVLPPKTFIYPLTSF